MVSRLTQLALAAALGAAASAQNPPPLVVRTAHAPTAEQVLAFFEEEGPLPDLTEGRNWRMVLDEQGALQIETDDSLIGSLQIGIRPNQLMEVYPGGLESVVARFDGFVTEVWRDAGLGVFQASPLIAFAAGIPRQVAHVRIRVQGNLDDPASDLGIQAWLRPLPDTWLSLFVTTVRPLGLRSISGLGGRSAVNLRAAVRLDGAEEALEPIYNLLCSAAAGSPEQAQRTATVSRAYWRTFDGTLAAQWKPREGSALSVIGLRDPDKVKAVYENPKLAEWMASQRTTPSGFEVEFTPDALEHGDARLWKSVARPAKSLAERLPDEFLQKEIVCHGGVVKSYLISAIGVEPSALEDLLKRANNHAFRRSVLPKMVMANARIWTAELLSARAEQFDLDRLPKTALASLGTNGELLFVSLRLQ